MRLNGFAGLNGVSCTTTHVRISLARQPVRPESRTNMVVMGRKQR